MPTPTVTKLLLFGATGDLSQRMLLPSLYNLHVDGLIAPGLRIIGTARSQLDDADFRELAGASLARFLPSDRAKAFDIERFLARVSYRTLDVTQPDQFADLAAAVDGNSETGIAIFLSTAPSLFEQTIQGLVGAGLAGPNVRIGLEKPLGHDLASSRLINDAVASAFPEERTFRIDHYLGKETVQNLIALRFANAMFEPLWNARGIEHVQITVSETVGLEGRGDFYDKAGALRDMVQNHMLQLLSLVAMEPPATFDGTSVRDEKVKVLRSLRPIGRTTAPTHSVIGQYGDGIVLGKTADAYVTDLGEPSNTETFVALKAHVDNWRWQGAPFYLRTGKRMAARQSEIFIQFKAVPHSMFSGVGAALAPNKLVISLQPEETIRLLVMAKEPGLDRDGLRLREVALDLSLTAAFAGVRRRIAYERLLTDLIEGQPTLFLRRDEVEAQWAWVDGIRDGWAANAMTPRSYTAGTWGPSSAIGLAERDGVSWHE
jgi:glucose-6-phosphate 1-dehydrogenase